MNILVINCSPVRDGATAWIAGRAAEQLGAAHTVRSICIDDYHFGFCRGCRSCHQTSVCFQHDDVDVIMEQFAWADILLSVAPSYWADIPGQYKAFIDRCTPWCNTHEPHASLPAGKRGYTIALRTGPGMPECERLIASIEHFYGHLEIAVSDHLGLTRVENRQDAIQRAGEVDAFCQEVLSHG